MTRDELEKYILKTYGAGAEYPWKNDYENAVFRHKSNKKWFALVMLISKRKLGFNNDEKINVVNVKCDANLVPSMWEQQGIYPAYHMNKEHWLTIALDGSADENNLKFLLALSYDLTDSKAKK